MADHPATDGEGTPTEREWLETVAADRLPDHAERAMREPGPVTREEAASMLFSGDYDHLLAGEFAALYPCPDPTPVSAAVSPAEPPEEKLARYRLTVIFGASNDGEAEFAADKATGKLAWPVIDSRLEKLL